MGKHPRGSFWLAALLLGVALLVGVGALVGGNRKPERRLPDSSLLTLEAVTYGKEHRFVHGSWWQKLLAPVLPASIKNQLRVDTLTSDSPDTLVLWTRRRGATPGQALRQPFW